MVGLESKSIDKDYKKKSVGRDHRRQRKKSMITGEYLVSKQVDDLNSRLEGTVAIPSHPPYLSLKTVPYVFLN